MIDDIQKDTVGFKFVVTLRKRDDTILDVSGATTKQITLTKPGGTTVTKTASFETDGSDGKISYTTVSGDLDTSGYWKIQGYVVLPSGEWPSSIDRFLVLENL